MKAVLQAERENMSKPPPSMRTAASPPEPPESPAVPVSDKSRRHQWEEHAFRMRGMLDAGGERLARPEIPKRRIRLEAGKSDGALFIWTIICLFIFIAGGANGYSFVFAFLTWIVPAFFLTFIYLIARAGRRRCPVCGTTVKVGLTECRSCGHDFAGAAAGGAR